MSRGRGGDDGAIELQDITHLPSTRILRLERQIRDTRHQLDENRRHAVSQQCTLERAESEHRIAQEAEREAERLLELRVSELATLVLQPGELDDLQRTAGGLDDQLRQVDSRCDDLEHTCSELRQQNGVLQARVPE